MCDETSTGNKYFQIWRNDKAAGFTFTQHGQLPSGVQSVSFADVGTISEWFSSLRASLLIFLWLDRDGTTDMVFTTCSSVSTSTGIGSDCNINIAYNQQLPLCTSTGASNMRDGKQICRYPEALCTADPDFRFDLSDRDDNDVRSYVVFVTFC